jgi:hypothetical protein
MNPPAHRSRSAAAASTLADESGAVLLFVLALVVITLAFGMAILAGVLSSNNLTTHDMRQQRAQAAANAGVQSQLYLQGELQAGSAGSSFDLNGGVLGLSNLLDCVEPTLNANLQITGLTTVSATSSGVCPSQSGGSPLTPIARPVGNHAYEESEFFPGATSLLSGGSPVALEPKIVSVGWDKQNSQYVYSREEAVLGPVEPLPVIGGNNSVYISGVSLNTSGLLGTVLAALEGLLGLSSSSVLTTIDGDVSAASNVTLPSVDVNLNLSVHNSGTSGTADNSLTGVIQLGVNGTLSPTNAVTTAQVLHDGPPPEQPISVPSTLSSCPTGTTNCGLGTYAAGPFYNSATDSVTVPAGQTMTIPGGVYVFCNFVANGNVVASPSSTQAVDIFIDNPHSSRCAPPVNAALTTSPSNFAAADSSFPNQSPDSYGNFAALKGISLCVTCVVSPSQIQIYVVGDNPQGTSPYNDDTYVEIGNPNVTGGSYNGLISTSGDPATEAMVVYAPTSEVEMTTVNCASTTVPLLGTFTLCIPGLFEGNLIGDDVYATAATFEQDLDLGNYALYDGVSLYHVQKYVQCSPPTSLSQYATGNETTDTNGC